jgi:DNA-binding CsgD family transcriptional regulator
MSKTASLKLQDVRAVFHLVGECRELGHDPDRWQTHLAEQLVHLTGSQVILIGEYRFLDSRPVPVRAIDVGWPSESAQRFWLEWHQDPSLPPNPALAPFLALPGARVTLNNLDVVSAREWRRSPFVNELIHPVGLGHGMGTRRPTPEGSEHVLNLVRAAPMRAFGARERTLVALLHDELEPHLGRSLATADVPVARLAPRLRQVLGCLLEGDSEKQAALRLGIAAATLHEYVTALYRHFGVASRAELMAYFLRRGWRLR